MGSPLYPIVANLFMDKFENKALDTFPLKPKLRIRFVNDTSVNWPHGDNELSYFLDHLNNISKNIKFTMEVEENNNISFLDIILIRNEDGTLGHKIFKNKAHTDNYLHADSHHHLTQKMGVLRTLFTRSVRISNTSHVDEEIEYSRKVFANIRYKNMDIIKTIRRARFKNKDKPPITSTQIASRRVYLPYIEGVTGKLTRVLKNKYIETYFKPISTIRQKMRSVIYNLGQLQQNGVYKVICSCEIVALEKLEGLS